MSNIKIFGLGGLDEDGRNITVVEIQDEIYIIDAGVKYPQTDLLGVEMIIPDMSYIFKNKDRVKGIFITQAHEDTMGAIGYLLKEVNAPVYTTNLNAKIVEWELKKQRVKNTKIFKIQRDANFKVGSRRCISFGLTHSIPDSFGIAIETEQGYIVHSSEFMIDFDVPAPSFGSDISAIADIGKKGVFALLTESSYAKKSGFTSPNHRISQRIEKIFEDTDKRIIATLYERNIYRLIEMIELAKRYKRKICIYGKKQNDLLGYLKELKYYDFNPKMFVSLDKLDNEEENMLIIVSDSGPEVFAKMSKIAMGEDSHIQLRSTDQVIVASPQVPGTEKIGNSMIDELFKDDVKVYNLSYKDVLSMHASAEDLKMMISLMKPRYYVPIKGEYQYLVANANIAVSMGISPANIVILDNGQVAEFSDGRLKSTSHIIELEEVMIDGKDTLDTSGLVLRDRQVLSTDGTIIVGIVLNNKTKEVVGGPDVQSRGVIYLKDAAGVMKEVGEIIERLINKNVKEKKYENIATRNESRDLISKYIYKETGKRPIILPVIIEIKI